MERFTGLIGIVLILGIAFLFSNNKRQINYRLVLSGLALQLIIAVLVFKVPAVYQFFRYLGKAMGKLESFAKQGADFAYGGISTYDHQANPANYNTPGIFVFAFNVTATIILVCVLVAIFYYLGIMQRIVSLIARAMNKVMRVSGAEALSNVASAFVGQVEAQVMIRPYIPTMTNSELLASMSGSLACIAGGILIVYTNMGIRAGVNIAPQLIAASLMAAPGALVISKIIYPETAVSQTMGKVSLKVKSGYSNLIDAISHGAADGLKIAMNVIAMVIGFIALIALLDWVLLKTGHLFNPDFNLSLNYIFAQIFYPFAWAMGIPQQDIANAATLLGQKLTINEFVAFSKMTSKELEIITPRGLTIVTVAICGFANFSSVGMQIGRYRRTGPGAPQRPGQAGHAGLAVWYAGFLFIGYYCGVANVASTPLSYPPISTIDRRHKETVAERSRSHVALLSYRLPLTIDRRHKETVAERSRSHVTLLSYRLPLTIDRRHKETVAERSRSHIFHHYRHTPGTVAERSRSPVFKNNPGRVLNVWYTQYSPHPLLSSG